jgi:hypothetical protein
LRWGWWSGEAGGIGQREAIAKCAKVSEDDIEAGGFAGLDGLEEADFEEDAFGSGVPKASFGAGQDIEDPGEDIGVEADGLFAKGDEFVIADFEEGSVALGNDDQQEIAEMEEQIAEHPTEVLAGAGEGIEFAQG